MAIVIPKPDIADQSYAFCLGRSSAGVYVLAMFISTTPNPAKTWQGDPVRYGKWVVRSGRLDGTTWTWGADEEIATDLEAYMGEIHPGREHRWRLAILTWFRTRNLVPLGAGNWERAF